MNTNMHGGGRRRSLWKSPALVTALIVTILLLASHFVDDWNWHPGAFVVVGKGAKERKGKGDLVKVIGAYTGEDYLPTLSSLGYK